MREQFWTLRSRHAVQARYVLWGGIPELESHCIQKVRDRRPTEIMLLIYSPQLRQLRYDEGESPEVRLLLVVRSTVVSRRDSRYNYRILTAGELG